MRRTDIPEQLTDLSLWPGVDASALEPERQTVYLRRERAIRCYFEGARSYISSSSWRSTGERCTDSSRAACAHIKMVAFRVCAH